VSEQEGTGFDRIGQSQIVNPDEIPAESSKLILQVDFTSLLDSKRPQEAG